jgi:hypothetical protein
MCKPPADKLARIIHRLIKHRVLHDPAIFAKEEEFHRQRRERFIGKQAALHDYQLPPLPSVM